MNRFVPIWWRSICGRGRPCRRYQKRRSGVDAHKCSSGVSYWRAPPRRQAPALNIASRRQIRLRRGQNLFVDFRSAEGKIELPPKLAAELVALKVNVIVAVDTPLAAQQATRRRGRRSDWNRSCDKSCPPGRQYHRCVADGGRVAWQVRRTVPQYASIDPPVAASLFHVTPAT